MGEDLRSSGVGLRGFESHPPHLYLLKKASAKPSEVYESKEIALKDIEVQ